MSKNIVICSDGTGQAGLGTTNVWRLFTALDLTKPKVQIACYDPGVGTIYDPEALAAETRHEPGAVWPPAVAPPPLPLRFLKQVGGLAFGAGLFENVRDLYEIIVNHYEEDDRIYLFGFSRGAFTVRVLAGLIYRCGVLRPEHMGRYSEAFALYRPHFESLTHTDLDALRARITVFRGAFAKPCEEITFMGFWDTVKSVGYLWPQSLPHTRRNPIVRTVRHALSIDESRSFYIPTTWGGLDADTQPRVEGQDVREVWFAGNHADIGGGYEAEEGDISKISLKWIGDAASECGLLVNPTKYQELFARGMPPPFERHNEFRKLFWRVLERVPRWELENDPPPPKRLFKWGPSGRRSIGEFARNGEVQVNSHAKRIYGADSPLWATVRANGTRVVFVER